MIDFISPESNLITAMIRFRQDIHSFPELAFNEFRTAQKVEEVLLTNGFEVHTGIAETGVVGVLHGARGQDGPSVMFRADMDALPVSELTGRTYCSQHEGVMHACGHDGHVAMLLTAAVHIAQNNDFSGTLYFLFQPAEENLGGAKAMIEDGLLERFPPQMVFGIHNWPELPAGQASASTGAVMASHATFDITVTGEGCHAACPEDGQDVVLTSSQLIAAMNTISARSVSPLDSAVVSVTSINSGNSYNALPAQAAMKGTVRYLKPETGPLLRKRIEEIIQGISVASGCSIELDYIERYPPTVNALSPTELARDCLKSVPGITNVVDTLPASMCAEDFSFILEQIPGCYIWLGNGSDATSSPLHSPFYDFNDEVLVTGANYWVSLTNRLMVAP